MARRMTLSLSGSRSRGDDDVRGVGDIGGPWSLLPSAVVARASSRRRVLTLHYSAAVDTKGVNKGIKLSPIAKCNTPRFTHSSGR